MVEEGMLRRLIVTLICGAIGVGLGLATVAARGEDVCPEPNDTFQQACYLGSRSDALGFISRPDDADAYRIEVLDFGVAVHVEVAESPAPYRTELANWNGDVIASSADGVLDATVDLPGTYYIFVDSPTGAFSDAEPYRLYRRLQYPGRIPQVLASADFRPSDTERNAADEVADYSVSEGRLVIGLKLGGTRSEPRVAHSRSGFVAENFTFAVDTRIEGAADTAGYVAYFRSVDARNHYVLTVDTANRTASLAKREDGRITGRMGPRQFGSINTAGGVNRTVVQCIGRNCRANVNGEEVFRVGDDAFTTGRLSIGPVTWGEPITGYFDNILVTVPQTN
jgi:hypothetical protein